MIIRNGSNIFSISDSKLYLIVKIKFYRFANPRTNASKKKKNVRPLTLYCNLRLATNCML